MDNFDKIIDKYRKQLGFEIGTHGELMLKFLTANVREEQIKIDKLRFKE